MMIKHLYFYVENIGLTNAQRDDLVNWLRGLGHEDDSVYPDRRMQTRIRLDNQAAIFEAVVNNDNLTAARLKTELARIFNVSADSIISVVLQSPYGEGMDLERPAGTKRIRFGVFAGRDATKRESAVMAIAYLKNNHLAWDGV